MHSTVVKLRRSLDQGMANAVLELKERMEEEQTEPDVRYTDNVNMHSDHWMSRFKIPNRQHGHYLQRSTGHIRI